MLLAHVTKDAERSFGLPSASWRLRKAGGVAQRLENKSQWCRFQSEPSGQSAEGRKD